MTTFKMRDGVLTLLVHLGCLTFDKESSEVFIANQEIARHFRRRFGWCPDVLQI